MKNEIQVIDYLIIITITFTSANRDFFYNLQHVRTSGPCATHPTLITSNVSCYKFDRVEIAFTFASFYWLNH